MFDDRFPKFDEGVERTRTRLDMQPPLPSSEPLPRGIYKRDDPYFPDCVIVELWTGDGRCIACSRYNRAAYESLWYDRIQDALDMADPLVARLRAI